MPADPHLQVWMVTQHHRLTSYFPPFFPGATRAPRVRQRGSSSRGHSAQPLLLAQAFTKRQQSKSLVPKGKKKIKMQAVCLCVCETE